MESMFAGGKGALCWVILGAAFSPNLQILPFLPAQHCQALNFGLCACFYPAVPSFFQSWDLSHFCFIFPQIFLLPPVTAAEHIFPFAMVFSVFLIPVLAHFLL